MSFARVEEVFKLNEGERVRLRGWVYNARVQGGLAFIDLRDSTGIVQVTIKKHELKNPPFESIVNELKREASLSLEGYVRHDPRAPNGVEILCESLEIIGKSEEYPIRKGVGTKFLLDHRHLYLRRQKFQAVLKIREKAVEAAEEWFRMNGFHLVHCPSFVIAACEGGATLFNVDYFGKVVHLTQSSQLYLEAAIFGLEKVYTIQPSFRAEKSKTKKHLTEFWHIEAEVAFATHEDIMNYEEDLVSYIVNKVVDETQKELELLGRQFEKPKRPFLRLTYAQAVELVNKKGIKMNFGDDFGTDAEKLIANSIDRPAFVMFFPVSTRAFYHMPNPEDPNLTLSSDLYAPGEGEITSGGQRIHDLDLLLRRLKEYNLNPEDYKWYIDLRRYGSVPHAGFGLGLERLVKWITGVNHIRNTVPFPRTPFRVYP
ncbi:MAG TPA: asparagine--tRNA ligase [Geobacterales bacterium]|nr:asparagine--tRNA ligase [Geobacterales bacterium]